MSSDTPRTDAKIMQYDGRNDDCVSANFARQLERELAAKSAEVEFYRGQEMTAHKDCDALRQRVEELGALLLDCHAPHPQPEICPACKALGRIDRALEKP